MRSRLFSCIALAAQLMRSFIQIMYGAWKIFGIPGPYVSIFGGARFAETDPYAHKAHDLARMLVLADISVLTGGGPGIMEAANCGAMNQQVKAKSIGIGINGLDQKPNQCMSIYFEMDYFFARKWLLMQYSSAIVIFPGGFGTLDEMSEVITLVQTKRIPGIPIVLIGKEYWHPFMRWIKTEVLKHGAVNEQDIALFTITDDLEEALCLVRNTCATDTRHTKK